MRIILRLMMTLTLLTSVAAKAAFPDGGGSNFPFVDLGAYPKDPTQANWNLYVKATLLHYHEYVSVVRSQLKAMRANGQTKISVVFWYIEDGSNCLTKAHFVCPQKGVIPAQVVTNMKNFIADVDNAGFNTMTIRMGAQSLANPLGDNYQVARIADSWKLFQNIYATCEGAIAGRKLKVLYDLGAEVMGHPYSTRYGAQKYLETMWANYIARYPVSKTIGFSWNHVDSVAAVPNLKIFANSGKWPVMIALDIYSDPATNLKNFSNALHQMGKDGFPVMIQETYRNNATMAAAFTKAQADYHLNFRMITQWPLDMGSTVPHSNYPFSPKIDAYIPPPPGPIPTKQTIAPIILSAGVGCADHNCVWVNFKNAETGSYLDIRLIGGTAPYSYRGADRTLKQNADGTYTITVRLKTAAEQNGLHTQGLRLWVVNPVGAVWNSLAYILPASP